VLIAPAHAPVDGLLDELRRHNPAALDLAVLVSGAVRIEQPLVRRLRLRLLAGADPSAEADLWFSSLVRVRSALGITLRADAVPVLRDLLGRRSDREAVRAEIAAAHAAQPPLLALEERLVWLGITEADDHAIHRELARVIGAMVAAPERRVDLSAWCVRALPQLPLAVQHNPGAWMLRIAAESIVPVAITLHGDPPEGLAEASVPALLPPPARDQVITVQRAEDDIIFCADPAASGHQIRVPGTDPLFLVVERGDARELLAIAPGHARTIQSGAARIDVRCLRGRHWRLTRRGALVPAERRGLPPPRGPEVRGDALGHPRTLMSPTEPIAAVSQHGAAASADPRATAFCRADGPDVFATIAHASHIHERDPFDVEEIHAEARRIFHHQLERVTTPEQAVRGSGFTLLVLGESGAGKTHLLRALRADVHGRRGGYAGYLTLTASGPDYACHVLGSVIDFLELPYDPPSLAESGLLYLSDGLVEGRDLLLPDELERLRTADLTPAELEPFIGGLVDRIVRGAGIERLDIDIVQVLLLLQRRAPALQRRIVHFLRCDPLTDHDRQLLGGVAPRDRPGNALPTLVQLARLMYELQLAPLVLLVDQVEDVVPDGRTVTRLQQALDSLRAIADAIPSVLVVICCLNDVYDVVKPRLSRPLVDRLARDQVRLSSQRKPDEIEQMLVRRLEHLYAFFDVAWRDDDSLYPFTRAQVAAVSQWRARDALGAFREYHHRCIAAGAIIPTAGGLLRSEPSPASPPLTPTLLDTHWQDLLAASAPPEDDSDVLDAVVEALRNAATERGFAIDVRSVADADLVVVEGPRLSRRALALCNHAPQAGSLAAQLAALRAAAARESAIAVALRSGDFAFRPRTKTAQDVGKLVAAGGLAVGLAEAHLRAAVAARTMAASPPHGYLTWRRARQPLCELPFVRQILELDREPGTRPPV
jgi:hypothetical protein